MRVIAGKFRSCPLRSLRGRDLRPTTDRLRETLFNVVAQQVPDAVWLDLYAGSGAVGIEALSRGARMAYFVEASRPAAAAIRHNLASLGIEDGFEILERDALQALRKLDAEAVIANLCFLDPPYHMADAYELSLGFLSQSRLLLPASVVIVEHDKHYDPGEACGALRRYRKLKQGDAVLSFYRLA
ncbi:MAG: 16S rRNA (guanine(966)-N(2))-methyltransferase RsmD [Terriglobales bacterium]